MDWSKRHFWSYQETFPVSIITLNLQFSLHLIQEISYAANLCEIFAIHLCMCKVTKNTVPPCSALMCSFIFFRSFIINLQWLQQQQQGDQRGVHHGTPSSRCTQTSPSRWPTTPQYQTPSTTTRTTTLTWPFPLARTIGRFQVRWLQ